MPDPSQLKPLDSRDRQPTDELIADISPRANGELVKQSICMFTNTPDENFLIDFVPDTNRSVLICSPCSGHGFKFASVIGEIVADLCLNGKSAHAIDWLGLARFGLSGTIPRSRVLPVGRH